MGRLDPFSGETQVLDDLLVGFDGVSQQLVGGLVVDSPVITRRENQLFEDTAFRPLGVKNGARTVPADTLELRYLLVRGAPIARRHGRKRVWERI